MATNNSVNNVYLPLAGGTLSGLPIVTAGIELQNGSGNTIQINPPASGLTNSSYVLPTAAPGTNGYLLSSDTSGNMSFVAPSGGGGGITSVNTQLFTSSGTYTPTANCVYAVFYACGAGGGGGGARGLASGMAMGSGGEGGLTGILSTNSPTTCTITIGAGGTAGAINGGAGGNGGNTLMGSPYTTSANGGSGSAGSTSVTTETVRSINSSEGVGSAFDFTVSQDPGSYGYINYPAGFGWTGGGGNSLFSQGVAQIYIATAGTGAGSTANGTGGGGGSGAWSYNTGTTSTGSLGGVGQNGCVYIVEYIT